MIEIFVKEEVERDHKKGGVSMSGQNEFEKWFQDEIRYTTLDEKSCEEAWDHQQEQIDHLHKVIQQKSDDANYRLHYGVKLEYENSELKKELERVEAYVKRLDTDKEGFLIRDASLKLDKAIRYLRFYADKNRWSAHPEKTQSIFIAEDYDDEYVGGKLA